MPRREDKAKETFGAETIENEIAQGRPIPLLPTGPFGVPLPGFVPTAPSERVEPKAAGGSGAAPPPGREPPRDDRDRLCTEPKNDRGAKNAFAAMYQEFVGSKVNPGTPLVPADEAYYFAVPGMTDVAIDHCNYKTGTLIEAKGHYYDKNTWKFMRAKYENEWPGQARRQLAVAEAYGRKLEWWFNEKEAVREARKIFKDNKITGIRLRYVPYPGNAQWPYPPDAKWARGRQK